MWASESTLMVHGLAIWFRLAMPAAMQSSKEITDIEITLSIPANEDLSG
jgi:hypothetical protein